jgi:hypothetical protein
LLIGSYQRARGLPPSDLTLDVLASFRERIIAYFELSGQHARAEAWRAEDLDAPFPIEPFAP